MIRCPIFYQGLGYNEFGIDIPSGEGSHYFAQNTLNDQKSVPDCYEQIKLFAIVSNGEGSLFVCLFVKFWNGSLIVW